MEEQIKQIDNIKEFSTLYEPIDSPEYNQYCKENGIVISYIDTEGKFVKYIEPNEASLILVHNPLFDGEKPRSYRETSLNGTYIDPRIAQEQFWRGSHPHLIDENTKYHIGFDPYKKEDGTIADISIYKRDENGLVSKVDTSGIGNYTFKIKFDKNWLHDGDIKQRTKLTLKENGKRDISGETKLSETK